MNGKMLQVAKVTVSQTSFRMTVRMNYHDS